MAARSTPSGRARQLVLLVLLALSATAAVLAARAAFAHWQPATTRGEARGLVGIKSERVLDLYPGAQRKLILILRNRDRRHGVAVRRIRVRDIATTKRGCAPSRRNLRIRQFRGPVTRIPPRGTRRVVVRLTMPYTVANACQRAVFKLRYTAQTATRRRGR
jgi:hypothetical protein